ncbi:MAG: AAA family ATPase [Candidatus Schmidhempelia sp.]|nr:AAA family ATPase [Candidatus Schmidhempelia sp.]
MLKLEEIEFSADGFRKLKNIKIKIAPRLTAIAGHNGIGKSTILGLIAHCSGLTKGEKSFFNKTFQSNFQEAFYLDYYDDFKKNESENNIYNKHSIILQYKLNNQLTIKKSYSLNLQKHPIEKKLYKSHMVKVIPKKTNTNTRQSSLFDQKNPTDENNKSKLSGSKILIWRLRIIPRTISPEKISSYSMHNSEILNQKEAEHLMGSAKIPIPTIYLGMSRMTPIGEFDVTLIDKKISMRMDNEDKIFIQEAFNQVLSTFTDRNEITTHIFTSSKKGSCVPSFEYNSFAISLGQDSLSSIITALASFNRLKRVQEANYKGGILVIDEVDAGLHPRAQEKLVELLHCKAKKLNLQIIITTHSLTILKSILDKNDHKGEKVNDVVYLKDSNFPHLMENPTYTKIKNDMLVLPPVEPKTEPIKIYFEDEEAVFFFKQILKFKNITNYTDYFGKELRLIAISVGCNVLMALHKGDEYFRKIILIPDNDVYNSKNNRDNIDNNDLICPLPGNKEFNVNTKQGDRPPESILYKYLFEKVYDKSDSSVRDFWTNMPNGYTSDYVSERVLTLSKNGEVIKYERESYKNWFRTHLKFFEESKLILFWCQENQTEIDNFLRRLKSAIELVSQFKE